MSVEEGDDPEEPHTRATEELLRCSNCDRLFSAIVNGARCPECGHTAPPDAGISLSGP